MHVRFTLKESFPGAGGMCAHGRKYSLNRHLSANKHRDFIIL